MHVQGYISLLQQCGKKKGLAEGKRLHAYILKNVLRPDVFLGNHIIVMYNKCGSVMDARQVFDSMPIRNMVSWNAMIGGYARHGHAVAAVDLFQRMQREGLDPDKVTFMAILRACNILESVPLGKLVHAHILGTRLQSDMDLGNTLVHMYGKCGNVKDARRIFDKMPQRNVISWNAMIAVYSMHGDGDEALQAFQQMEQEGVHPDKITFICMLNACNSPEDLELGKLVHTHILKKGVDSDVVVSNALVNMYGKCGSIKDARTVFDMMQQRDVVTWSTMIGGYAGHNHSREVFKLFQLMQKQGVKPDKITFINLLNACTTPEIGKLVHACAVNSQLESDVSVGNALVSMYGKCGSIIKAWKMFNKMPRCNSISWNVMITAYASHGYCHEAFSLFQQMQQEGVKADKISFISILNACDNPKTLQLGRLVHANIVNKGFESDVIVGTALVNMFGKCGSIKDARRIFDRMPHRNVISWTVMIGVSVQYGCYQEAFELFQQMQQEGVKPNKITLLNVINTCDSPEALALGKLIHSHVEEQGFELDVGSALIGMYGKCGSIKDALMVFNKISKDDVVSWSAMIAAYAHHGQGREALEIFREMQRAGIKADMITMISVLNACSHAGFVDEGLYCFSSMCEAGMTPALEHYNCIVDLFSRAGHLDEAEEFISKMPFQPDTVTWTTFLGSCRNHGCIDQGQHVAECLLKLDPQSASAYVALANIYAAAGRWGDVAELKKLMGDKDVKEPGSSWFEAGDMVQAFS